MTSSSAITVGLPCRNAQETVQDAVRSVFAQTSEDWRLILVDDGSTDRTRDILERIRDPRVALIADGEHRGLAARLNQIASLARGSLLARMDADDMMFPWRLERQQRYMDTHPECGVVGSAIVCTDRQGEPRGMRRLPAEIRSARDVLAQRTVFHPTVLGRTEWFRRHGYDETCELSQDFDLWARHAGNLVLCNLPDPLLFYREYGAYAWSKYRCQSRRTRAILWREGPSKIGRACTARLLAVRTGKDAIYAVLNAAGLWSLAMRLRNRRMSPQDARRWRALVQKTRQQPVPGWAMPAGP